MNSVKDLKGGMIKKRIFKEQQTWKEEKTYDRKVSAIKRYPHQKFGGQAILPEQRTL
jgi:hypothetical protein